MKSDRRWMLIILAVGSLLILCGCHRLDTAKAEMLLKKTDVMQQPIIVSIWTGQFYTDPDLDYPKECAFSDSLETKWAEYEGLVHVERHGPNSIVTLTDLGKKNVTSRSMENCRLQYADIPIGNRFEVDVQDITFYRQKYKDDYLHFALAHFNYAISLNKWGEDLMTEESKFLHQLKRSDSSYKYVEPKELDVPHYPLLKRPGMEGYFAVPATATFMKRTDGVWDVLEIKFDDDGIGHLAKVIQ